MAEIDPRELETLDCKTFSCTREALTSKGWYAYLCEVHKKQKQDEDLKHRTPVINK